MKVNGKPRARTYKSPLDKAYAHEIDWPQVAPVFDAARDIGNPSFVYLTGEQPDGPVKIGVAKDPISRLRGMQTGNSRRLRVERLLIGDRDIEQLLHQIWRRFAIVSAVQAGKPDAPPGTEWFEPEIREELFPVVDTAVRGQIEYVAEGSGELDLTRFERIIWQAHGAHDAELNRPDVPRLLGAVGGYYRPRRVRV